LDAAGPGNPAGSWERQRGHELLGSHQLAVTHELRRFSSRSSRCLRCLGAVALQPTGPAWAVPNISSATATVEELGPAPVELCRVLKQACSRSKAAQHPAVAAFGCAPGSGCGALAADWGKRGCQLGKWSLKLVLGCFLSPSTPCQAGCFRNAEGPECPGAGKCQLSKMGAEGSSLPRDLF